MYRIAYNSLISYEIKSCDRTHLVFSPVSGTEITTGKSQPSTTGGQISRPRSMFATAERHCVTIDNYSTESNRPGSSDSLTSQIQDSPTDPAQSTDILFLVRNNINELTHNLSSPQGAAEWKKEIMTALEKLSKHRDRPRLSGISATQAMGASSFQGQNNRPMSPQSPTRSPTQRLAYPVLNQYPSALKLLLDAKIETATYKLVKLIIRTPDDVTKLIKLVRAPPDATPLEQERRVNLITQLFHCYFRAVRYSYTQLAHQVRINALSSTISPTPTVVGQAPDSTLTVPNLTPDSVPSPITPVHFKPTGSHRPRAILIETDLYTNPDSDLALSTLSWTEISEKLQEEKTYGLNHNGRTALGNICTTIHTAAFMERYVSLDTLEKFSASETMPNRGIFHKSLIRVYDAFGLGDLAHAYKFSYDKLKET